MADHSKDRRDDDRDDERNPLEELFRQLGMPGGAAGLGGGADMEKMMSQLGAQLEQAFGQVQRMFAADPDGPVLDREVVSATARRTIAAAGEDPAIDAETRHELRVAVELADSWLDEATAFTSAGTALTAAWTREEWVTHSMPMWVRLTDPIVTHLADALEALTHDQSPEMGGMAELAAQIRPMLRKAAGGMFAAQMGEALGQVALGVVSATDLGFPVAAEHVPALLPAGVQAFIDDVEQDPREVQLYLALREVARQRLFASVAWLEPQVIALVEHYAREIRIDPTALEEAFQEATQVGPDQMALTFDGSLFEPERTQEQTETLERLETLLALVEGWVDDVVAVAAQRWLTGAPALSEAVRRRRAAGGPTQQALQALVGLEMSPRRVRDAATLWAALRDARGVEGRDEVWSHPESQPTPADLDDPLGFVQGESAEDAATAAMDEELRQLLEGEAGSEG